MYSQSFYKSQEVVSSELKDVIDRYWEMEITDDEMVKFIKQITQNNLELLFKNNDFTAIVKQRLGVRRIRLMGKILTM